jgi:hypothetical protein
MMPFTCGRISAVRYAVILPGNSVVNCSDWGCSLITDTCTGPMGGPAGFDLQPEVNKQAKARLPAMDS